MANHLSILASAIALTAGVAALSVATDGGRAWTAESARRVAIEQNPIAIEPLSLIAFDSPDLTVSLQSLWGNPIGGSKLVLMEFIYTQCPTVCQVMGAEFAAIQNHLFELEERADVRLLSVSFDPQDDLAAMGAYGKRYAATEKWWTLAIPENRDQLRQLQHQLGSIVIPEPTVGFIHNSAIYAIYQGRVVAILDHDDRQGIKRVISEFGLVKGSRHDAEA